MASAITTMETKRRVRMLVEDVGELLSVCCIEGRCAPEHNKTVLCIIYVGPKSLSRRGLQVPGALGGAKQFAPPRKARSI